MPSRRSAHVRDYGTRGSKLGLAREARARAQSRGGSSGGSLGSGQGRGRSGT